MKFQMLHPHSKSLLLINQLIAELITQLCNQPKNIFLFTWRLLVWKSAGKRAIETHNHNAIPLINIINSLANTESKIDKKTNVSPSLKLWLCAVIKCKFNIGKVNTCNLLCHYINPLHTFLIEILIAEILLKSSRSHKTLYTCLYTYFILNGKFCKFYQFMYFCHIHYHFNDKI